MKQLSILLAIVTALGLAAVSEGGLDSKAKHSAAEQYRQAGALLEDGSFDEALKLYAAAAKADPGNQAYRQQYALLRQVQKLREYYPLVTDADTRAEMAAALRTFYYDNRAYTAALELDRQRHVDLHSAETAAMLAETHLAMTQNRQAMAVLSELDESRQTVRTKVLHVTALAREGMKDRAQALASKIGRPEKADPGFCFEMACMYSLLGDTAAASEMLTKCFEGTLPSQLEKARAKAADCPDLKPLEAAGQMKKLLAVESKVSESSCSSGASCATCPVRGNCGSTGSAAAGNGTDKK